MNTMNVDGAKLVNFASQLDQTTIAQAEQTASMSFVYPHVALMPDAHTGKGAAVGTVIPTVGAVIPAAVGVDIGCGMIAARTRFTNADITGKDLATLRKALEAAIPLSPGHYNRSTTRFPFTKARVDLLDDMARTDKIDLSHSPKWAEQLGSLGGGNHFIELCLDEQDRVWMFLHSGSRGVGNRIAQKHIAVAQAMCQRLGITLPHRDLAYLTEGTPEFDAYLRELRWAQRFALENRAEMMDRFRAVLADWLGVQAQRVEVDRLNCHHNYTQQESHAGKTVWLTRKGAVDAHAGVRAIIPGSMGTHSYIVTGKGSPEGLCSAPHGAGRRFSRTKAKQLFTEADLDAAMTGIEFRRGAQFVDEIPAAYKDIDTVMADAADLVQIDHELRQVMNLKGT